MTRQLTRTVEEGPERFCRRCDEWWPDDGEFWYVNHNRCAICKACQRERGRLSHERMAASETWKRRRNLNDRLRNARRKEAAGWAYQYAGALMAAGKPPDARLLDVLVELAEGRCPTVEWPARVAA